MLTHLNQCFTQSIDVNKSPTKWKSVTANSAQAQIQTSDLMLLVIHHFTLKRFKIIIISGTFCDSNSSHEFFCCHHKVGRKEILLEEQQVPQMMSNGPVKRLNNWNSPGPVWFADESTPWDSISSLNLKARVWTTMEASSKKTLTPESASTWCHVYQRPVTTEDRDVVSGSEEIPHLWWFREERGEGHGLPPHTLLWSITKAWARSQISLNTVEVSYM